MGYTAWMEKRAQQGMLKLAMEAAWTASCGVGMVLGPLTMALKTSGPTKTSVDALLDDWLGRWQHVRHLSDRALGRNRPHYVVRPNEVLSPILLKFEQELRAIRSATELDGAASIERLQVVNSTLLHDLARGFGEWAKEAGKLVDFDAGAHEDRAVSVGQQYWAKTVRELERAIG